MAKIGSAPRTKFCSYKEGMFANDFDLDGRSEEFGALAIVAHHEAGHGVLSFALGHGCFLVQIHEEVIANKGLFAGVNYGNPSVADMVAAQWQSLLAGTSTDCRLIVEDGVVSAAGPAAERKYRLLTEMPLCIAERAFRKITRGFLL
jgi:hypothetical protein